MVDLTIVITDENREDIAAVTIYQDGSDAEAATRIIQWVVENYQVDDTDDDGLMSPFPVTAREPDPTQRRPVYREATEEELRRYAAVAKEWMRSNNPASMFTDTKSTAQCAIAEFLANQEGVTVYKGGVGQPLDKRLIKQRKR